MRSATVNNLRAIHLANQADLVITWSQVILYLADSSRSQFVFFIHMHKRESDIFFYYINIYVAIENAENIFNLDLAHVEAILLCMGSLYQVNKLQNFRKQIP